MSFGGSVSAMNKTIQQNRNLIKKISVFDNRKKIGFNPLKKKKYQYKKATAEELLNIRTKILDQNKSNFVRRMVLLALVIAGVGCLVYLGLSTTVSF